MMRTTKVEWGTKPYNWSSDCNSIYQCTWFAFYSALEEGKTAPCYWDRPTRTGSYTDAKDWLDNYREPWIVIRDLSYQPVAGDRAIFDGKYGHVIVVIDNNGGDCLCSEYRSGDPNSFRVFNWKAGSGLSGCGALLGYLHWPYNTSVDPVERNEYVDQIECTDSTLRLRNKPSLEGEIIGHVKLGYYNVISKKDADGYTWYEIAKDIYCADLTTIYLPAKDNILKQLEAIYNSMQRSIEDKDEKIRKRDEALKQIHDLSGGVYE